MKKHSAALRASVLVLCFVLTLTGAVINTYAALSRETDLECPYGPCTENLMISGPYSGNDAVDISVPFIGGETYENLYRNLYDPDGENIGERHMYAVYCNEFDINDSSSDRHAMTLVFPAHGYTPSSYEQYDSAKHITTYVCDHSEESLQGEAGYAFTQTLCGENAETGADDLYNIIQDEGDTGCGSTKTEAENHQWIYSGFTETDSTKHSVTRTCSLCGYTDTVEQAHSLVYGEWSYLTATGGNDGSKHRRTVTCSLCGYLGTEEASHRMVRDFEGWKPSDATWHYYTDHCTVCGYAAGHYSQHAYNNYQNIYTDISDTQHHVLRTCKYCGRQNEYDENHTLVDAFESVSDTEHVFRGTCVCGRTETYYTGLHNDDDDDCYCDDCGYLMTRFSVTVPSSLTLVTDRDGNVYAPTNASITNNSTAPVKVMSITLTAKNGWTVVPYATDMSNEKVDSKIIGLKIRDSISRADGTMPLTGSWTIFRNGSLALTYSAVVSATSRPLSDLNILDVTFVIDWRD